MLQGLTRKTKSTKRNTFRTCYTTVHALSWNERWFDMAQRQKKKREANDSRSIVVACSTDAKKNLTSILPILALARIPLIRPGTGVWIWIRVVKIQLLMTVHWHRIVMSWNRRGLAGVVRTLNGVLRECWYTIRHLCMPSRRLCIVYLRIYIFWRHLPLGVIGNHRYRL